jgi:CRP/FNR family transcriptional regulator
MGKAKVNCDLQSCYLCRFCLPEWRVAISNSKTTQFFKKGEQIFSEGNTVNRLYFLYDGVVKVHKKWEADKELIIRFAKKGDVLGHRGLGKDPVYPVTATALEPAIVCSIDLEFFKTSIKINSELAYQLLMFFATELQESEKKMSQLAHMQVKGRIAYSLLQLKEKFGTDHEGFISFSISRQDLSAFAGTIYETVYKFLNELSAENIIEISEKRIRIMDENRLSELTQ